jgi:hypothetical protein
VDGMSYENFLQSKVKTAPMTGIAHDINVHDRLNVFQRDIVKWSLRRGRAAIFAGTGLGKTFMQLSWAKEVCDYTRGNVLIFAPLAVAHQTVGESVKFGIECNYAADHSMIKPGANVTNYQKMHHFDLSKFEGVVLDESSILKNEKGAFRTALIDQCKDIPFRLAATATPSPNDFMELGNHAEFLSIMSYTDMLSMFFAHDGGSTQNWRLKGHAEDAFWTWVCSWAVMMGHPRDLGYEVDGYDLPKMHKFNHTADVEYSHDFELGTLFPINAHTMQERISARRSSVNDRVELAASITPKDRPFVWWCNLNTESELLAKTIPGAVEVRGSDKDDAKEQKLRGFSNGDIRVLITKPSIAGFGMNWQHCADTGFVGLNDSYEQIFQAVRRFWRFGQTKQVNVHFISSELEGAVVSNIQRKEAQAEKMMAAMIRNTSDITSLNIRGAVRDTTNYLPQETMQLPKWMRG